MHGVPQGRLKGTKMTESEGFAPEEFDDLLGHYF